jgi:hypothetical protein
MRFAHEKSLSICVYGYELNTTKARFNHSIKSVDSTATDSNDLYYGQVVLVQTHDAP